MRRLAIICASILTLLLVAVLGLGLYGKHTSKQTADALQTETNIAQQLLTLQETAKQHGHTELAHSADEQLAQLPASARQLASQAPTDPDQKSEPRAVLPEVTDTLLNTAYATDDAALRAFLVTASDELWAQGQAEKIVTEKYPPALQERVEKLGTCTPADNRPEAPKTLAQVLDTLNALSYATGLYDARAELENYSSELEDRITELAQESNTWYGRSSSEFSCSYQLPAHPATG